MSVRECVGGYSLMLIRKNNTLIELQAKVTVLKNGAAIERKMNLY